MKRRTRKFKRNPIGRSDEMRAAEIALEKFSGESPTVVHKFTVPELRVGWRLGYLDGVPYETVRDGKVERYFHRFRRNARPHLIVSSDGRSLGIVGGRFRVTDRGIVDE